jgi:hypothetical protein
MVRVFLSLVAIGAAGLLAGTGGAFAGMCAVLTCPLSPANFAYALNWGIASGAVGGMIGGALWLTAEKPILVNRIIATGLLTFLTSAGVMWWNVVTSLG